MVYDFLNTLKQVFLIGIAGNHRLGRSHLGASRFHFPGIKISQSIVGFIKKIIMIKIIHT